MISTFNSNNSITESTILPTKKLIIEGTRYTPQVVFDTVSGYLEIKGISSPESSHHFYIGINNEIDNLTANSTPTFQFDIALKYFNTSSAKSLHDIFQKLIALSKSSTKVVINWFYESGDYDILESGEEFAETTELKFNFIETK